MAFNVRIFGHRGTKQLPQLLASQFSSIISEALWQPYEWSQVITTAGGGAVNSAAVAVPDGAAIVVIEVPDGQTIRYEFNPTGRVGGAVAAGSISPKLSGVQIFPWSPGTILSFVEASFYP